MGQIKRIGLIGRAGSRNVRQSLEQIILHLSKQQIQMVIEKNTASLISVSDLPVVAGDELGLHSDLVIVVGGDGSLLGSARVLTPQKVPVLGVNRGSLGFLTDISPHELEVKVDEVLAGEYEIEKRFLLDTNVTLVNEEVGSGTALNDVVLHPGRTARMIQFEVYIDKQFVYSQRSDGLIIATPTGSTAYALSGGGPIMHPKLDAVVLVPMFPHTLSSRPIVIDGNSEIRIVVSETNSLRPRISCDGQIDIAAAPGSEILVKKAPEQLLLVHPRGHDYYQTCRSKLGWGNRLGSV